MRTDAEETEVRRQATETAKLGVSLHHILLLLLNLEERRRAHSLSGMRCANKILLIKPEETRQLKRYGHMSEWR